MLNIICGLKEQEDMTTHILEWIKSKNLTISTAGKDAEQQELSFISGLLDYGFLKSLTKPKIVMPCNPAVVLLGIYPIDLKIYVYIKTCM